MDEVTLPHALAGDFCLSSCTAEGQDDFSRCLGQVCADGCSVLAAQDKFQQATS